MSRKAGSRRLDDDLTAGRNITSSSTLAGLLIGNAVVSDCREFLCELDALGYMFGGMLFGAGVGAGVGASYPPDRWVRVDLPVQAGFPPYRTPFHETFAFKLLYSGLGIALLAIIN